MFSMHKHVWAVLATFAALSACKQTEPEEGSTGNVSEAGYSLAINDLASEIQGGGGGTFSLAIQLKKDDNSVSADEATITISLQITCGTDKSETYKEDTDDKGIATFADISIEDTWQGECEVEAKATVGEEDIFRKAKFTITTAGDDDNNNGEDTPLSILQWKIGKGYPLAGLEDGKLTMHNCDKGRLYHMLGDEPPQLKDEVEISNDTSHVFVLNAPDTGCELYLDGEPYIKLSKDANHPLKDIWRGFGSRIDGRPFIVKLGNKPDGTSSAQLYHGSDLDKFDGQLGWGGDTNLGDQDHVTSINNQVLLKAVVNSEIWHAWNKMLPHGAQGSPIGSLRRIMGLGTSPIDITLINDCGMQVVAIKVENGRRRDGEIEQGLVLNKTVKANTR